ncbi:protein ASPARTIC PROTEASE IN GUARD CELL 2-like [Panicum miliaceum]|uniref:Protein ASPARTIC PROTEASE IN GUARD CELL 2-like n=1 Tax=Panicum miliaceum TaxID=4540 RepID=A0A3L6Q871_PANMI|nr:protein ASPARTIC PROTEASE IN GUARD CELL 2-like [Panicum miliaceum]
MHATTIKQLLLLLFVSTFMLIISHASSIRFHYINSHNFTTKTSAASSSPSSSSSSAAHRSRNPSLALVHRDAITGATYPSRRHAVLDRVGRDNARADSGCGDAGRCQYEVSYGDGSYTKGVLALETLIFGGTAVEGVAIGCGHRNHGLFVGAAGLLGLGWGPMSLVGQLGGAAGGAFSYCLASRGPGSNADAGSLVLGRSEAVPEGAVWVPLVRNPQAPSFYYVGLSGIGVGDERLPLEAGLFQLSDDGAGGVVMDTGTAVTRLPQEAYAALRDAFAGAVGALPRAPGVSLLDTCYDLSGYTSVRVPTVSFYFDEGATLTLPARNLLVEVDGGIYCLAFAPSSSGLSILGNIQQEGIQITVDSANGFIGFGPNTC